MQSKSKGKPAFGNSRANISKTWGIKSRDKVMPNKLFADSDRDGVPNVFDCRPNNKRRQDVMMPRISGNPINDMFIRQENTRKQRINQMQWREAQENARNQEIMNERLSNVSITIYPGTLPGTYKGKSSGGSNDFLVDKTEGSLVTTDSEQGQLMEQMIPRTISVAPERATSASTTLAKAPTGYYGAGFVSAVKPLTSESKASDVINRALGISKIIGAISAKIKSGQAR